ncbi:hypothetical protein [Gordonia sihwensis]|uniref:hypothetical protein n=1 Tax=Gordonia sihwensis TaxID=173559 RepID=UPI003D97E819
MNSDTPTDSENDTMTTDSTAPLPEPGTSGFHAERTVQAAIHDSAGTSLGAPEIGETAADLARDGRALTWTEFTAIALGLLARLEDRVLIPVTIGPGTGDPHREFWADAISILAEDLRNEPTPTPERASQLVDVFTTVFRRHSLRCRVRAPKQLRRGIAVYAPDSSLLTTVLRTGRRTGRWRVFGRQSQWSEDMRLVAQSQRSENPLYDQTVQARQVTDRWIQDMNAPRDDHRRPAANEASDLPPRELAEEAVALFNELEMAWLHYLSDTEACVLTKPLLAVDDDPVTAEYLRARFHAKELIDDLPSNPSSAQAHQAHAAARAASEAWDRADRHAAEVGLGIFTANERAVLRRIRSLVDTIADQTIQAPARSNYIRQLHTLLGRIASVEGFGAHLSEMPQLAAVAPMLQLAPPARSSRRDPDLNRPEADSRRPSRKDA